MRRLYVLYSEKEYLECRHLLTRDDTVLAVGESFPGADISIALHPGDYPTMSTAFSASLGSDDWAGWHVNSLYEPLAIISQVLDLIAHHATALETTQIVLRDHQAEAWAPTYLTGWGEAARSWQTSPSRLLNAQIEKHFGTDPGVKFLRRRALGRSRGRAQSYVRTVTTAIVATVRQLQRVRNTTPGALSEDIEYIIGVRSEHQLRSALLFVQVLGLERSEYVLLEAEMLASRNLPSLIETTGSQTISVFHGPRARLACVCALLRSIGSSASILTSRRTLSFESGLALPAKICLRESALKADCWMQPQIAAYKASLKRTIGALISHSNKRPTYISFEQISAHAAVEAQVVSKLGIDSAAIKTTVILPRAIPVVSPFDYFLAESEAQAGALRRSTARNEAAIVHIGSLRYSALAIPRRQGSSLKRMVFATQPFADPSINLQILAYLKAKKRLVCDDLLIRPHPRDLTDYSSLTDGSTLIEADGELFTLLRSSSLLVSRTSTVLEDALLIGVPAMSIQPSPVDREFGNRLDYLSSSSPLTVRSFDEIGEIFERFEDWKLEYYSYRNEYIARYKSFTRSDFERKVGA